MAAMLLVGLVFLLFGLMLWGLQVDIGLKYLEVGKREVTARQIEIDAIYDSAWIWLSVIPMAAWAFSRHYYKAVLYLNIAVYSLLALSLVWRLIAKT